MTRGGEMQQVDLVSDLDDETTEPAASPQASRRRWWAVGIVGLIAIGLAGGQWLLDSREDAAVARLQALPGVVPTIDEHLVARPVSQETVERLWGGPQLVRVAADGAQSLTWQPAGGGRPWSVDLLGPTAALAREGARTRSSCQGDEAAPDETAPDQAAHARFVVCDVTDGGWVSTTDSDDGYTDVPSTRDEVVVFDASDGSVVTRWALPQHASVATIGDVVAVGAQDGRDATVTGYETSTGDRRWTYRPATDGLRADVEWGGVLVNRVGQLLQVQTTAPTISLLSADGTEVRTFGSDVDPEIGGYVSCQDEEPVGPACTTSTGSDESVTLLGEDAAPAHDRTLTGSLVRLTVDDASLPGLVLTRDEVLHAWDATSGRSRWKLGSGSGSDVTEALVVDGLVYVVSAGTLTAYDGRTGDVRWTAANEAGEVATGMVTDGRHVAALYESGTGSSFLVAFDARSGERLFRAEYPSGVDGLTVVGRQLVGYTDDGDGSDDDSTQSFSIVE